MIDTNDAEQQLLQKVPLRLPMFWGLGQRPE